MDASKEAHARQAQRASPQGSGPNCWQCAHFGITYVPGTPYACHYMGFRTNVLPAIEVLRVDGVGCRAFVGKARVG